jgi:hypothetical protein
MKPEDFEAAPQISSQVPVELTGQLFAVWPDHGSPILIDLPPPLGPSFALFRRVEELRFYLAAIGIVAYRIKHVDDGREFMKSQIPYPIVCDMRYDPPTGKSKWKLVVPTEKA